MVDKLKIALVLLIIGSVSGLAIVGMNTLTEDRIEENQLRAQYEDYVAMFPELADIEEEPLDNDGPLDMKFTVYDSNGEELGTIFRGHDTNSQGDITVLVGISGNTLVDVIISSTTNTPSYVTPLQENHISKLSNTPIGEISYDASTGATITYESVQKIVDAAIIESGGEVTDPELDLYQEQFDSAESYGMLQKFDDAPYDYEKAVYDSDGAFVGFSYRIPLDEGNVYLLLDSQDAFMGFYAAEEATASAYSDALDAFDAYTGSPLGDISHDGASDTETVLANAIDSAHALIDGTTRINADFLSRYEPYMVDGAEAGTLYTGMSEGYKDDNVIQVAIDDAGEIIHVEIVLTSDTIEGGDYFPGVQELVIDELDVLYGQDSVTEEGTDDAFAGASTTGGSVYDVVNAALQYESERTGE